MERGEQSAGDRRFRQNAHDRFHHHAQQSFRAGDDAKQIEPLAAGRLAAETQARAIRQREFHAQQVVRGEAVFEAMQSAGILRDVAADGAGDLARGIGRVIEAVALHRAGDGGIGDARLDHHAAVFEVGLQDAIHAAEAEQDAVGPRQRPARQRGAGAARHDGHAHLVGEREHGGDLVLVLRQHADQRRLAIGGERIAVVGGEPRGFGYNAIRHEPLQRSDDFLAAGNDLRIGYRKCDHGPIIGPNGQPWRALKRGFFLLMT